MQPEMFGDSYDFLKRRLLQNLEEGWITHPMYFDTQPEVGFPPGPRGIPGSQTGGRKQGKPG